MVSKPDKQYCEYTWACPDIIFGARYEVTICFYRLPEGISIEAYELDDSNVSREEIVDMLGEDRINSYEEEIYGETHPEDLVRGGEESTTG
jgi:hypothetical protein